MIPSTHAGECSKTAFYIVIVCFRYKSKVELVCVRDGRCIVRREEEGVARKLMSTVAQREEEFIGLVGKLGE